jgi:hypothetical protein
MKLFDITPMLTVEAGQVQVIALLCCKIVNLSVSIT